MNSFNVVFSLFWVLVSLLGLVWLLVREFGTRARVRKRLKVAVTGTDADMSAATIPGFRKFFAQLFGFIGRRLPLFSVAQRKEMRAKLVSAGFRQANGLQVLMGLSAGAALLCVVLTILLIWPALTSASSRVLALVVAIYAGLLLPRIVLDKLVSRRQTLIANSFPDALDLMVVCANAGLGLNATLQRVAQEMMFLAPELSDELNLTALQMQISADQAEVLEALADRVRLDSVRSLAATLTQSRQYGTPISDALRVLASGERIARRMRTEAAAGKLATKMTIPMMLFIMPTVLMIVGGPAILSLIKSLGGMTQ